MNAINCFYGGFKGVVKRKSVVGKVFSTIEQNCHSDIGFDFAKAVQALRDLDSEIGLNSRKKLFLNFSIFAVKIYEASNWH